MTFATIRSWDSSHYDGQTNLHLAFVNVQMFTFCLMSEPFSPSVALITTSCCMSSAFYLFSGNLYFMLMGGPSDFDMFLYLIFYGMFKLGVLERA